MFTEKTYIHPKIEIKKSHISGKGMFAKDNILENEILIKWGGKFFTSQEIQGINKSEFLIIQIDEDLWSIEKHNEYEDDYFINHSCDANTWMVDGRTFVSKIPIKKGEEITLDYALFESEEYLSSWNCHCGCEDCRKHITGKDYLLASVQKKYRHHFSPIVQKRIDRKKSLSI